MGEILIAYGAGGLTAMGFMILGSYLERLENEQKKKAVFDFAKEMEKCNQHKK